MKKFWAIPASLLFGLSLVACGDSSSSASDNDLSSAAESSSSEKEISSSSEESSSSGEADECTLAEDGVKILAPVGGEVFSLGDSIEIRFVAKSNRAGGFKAYYKASADAEGENLFKNSIGEEAPDGTRCETVRAYLDPEQIEASDNAFIRVEAYNAPKVRANSGTFTVKE